MKIYEINNIFIFINWVLKYENINKILIIYPFKKKPFYNILFKLANINNFISDKEIINKKINNKYVYFVESEIINITNIPKKSNFITFNFDLLYFSKCNVLHEYLSKKYYFRIIDNIQKLPLIKLNIIKKPFILENLKNIYLFAVLVEKKLISRNKLNKLLVNKFKKSNCDICYQKKKTINSCCNLNICLDCLLHKGFKKCCPICKKYNKIKDDNFIIPLYLENYFEINKNRIILNNYLLNIDKMINNINLYFEMDNFYFLNNKEINLYKII